MGMKYLLVGCGKTVLVRENFDPRVWHHPGLSGHLIYLVQANNRDRLNRPNEQDRLANFFSILLWGDGGWAMDRRRLRTFLALFNVEGDISAVTQFIECETLQHMFVKVHLAAAFFQDEAVSFYGEQFADYA
jgi:hypothetical protein